MKLIYIPGACSLAVHIALNQTNSKFDLLPYSPATGLVNDDQPLSSMTKKPYVPTLIMNDGEVLNETAAIMMSLDEMHPKAELLPKDIASRRAAREWLVFTSSELHKTFAPLFSPATPDAQKEQIRERIAQRFDHVAQELSTNGPFLLGDKLYAPDMYMFVMTLWAGVQNISLDHWPSIVAFQKAVGSADIVAKALAAEGLPVPGATAAAE